MRFSNVKLVIIGVSAAAAVIAITGAASGSGVGAVFNLGKTNTVNATSMITHIATVSIIAEVAGPNCDFDASAIIGPGVKGP